MIRTIFFDLDGVLVQTEKLKAGARIHTGGIIENDWIVQDPANVARVVLKRIHQHNQIEHRNHKNKPT